jgi:hypothetical protein
VFATTERVEIMDGVGLLDAAVSALGDLDHEALSGREAVTCCGRCSG